VLHIGQHDRLDEQPESWGSALRLVRSRCCGPTTRSHRHHVQVARPLHSTNIPVLSRIVSVVSWKWRRCYAVSSCSRLGRCDETDERIFLTIKNHLTWGPISNPGEGTHGRHHPSHSSKRPTAARGERHNESHCKGPFAPAV
jgi:hypothetical protein